MIPYPLSKREERRVGWFSAASFVFAALVLLAMSFMSLGCNTPSDETVKFIDQTLETFERHGVNYEFELSGPVEAHFELYSGGRVGTGGHFAARVRSGSVNPPDLNEPESQPVTP